MERHVTKSVRAPKSFVTQGAFLAAALLAAGHAYNTHFSAAPQISFAGPAAAAGELDTGRLPRIAGATETYVSAATTILVSPEGVSATIAATMAGLAAEGWQRYDAPFTSKSEDPDRAILTFKKGALGLNVFVTIAPAQGNTTSVTYSPIPYAHELPFFADGTDILFDPTRPYLTLLTGESVEKVMAFYNGALIERGWTPWSVKEAAKKPDGAIQGTDLGQYSYYVRDGKGPVIAVVQRQKDGRTIAKIEPVPASILTASAEKDEEPTSVPTQPSAAAEDMHRAFDALANDVLKQAREAAAEAIAGIGKPDAMPAAPAQPEAPLAAIRDLSAPIPIPETADNLEIDGTDGAVDFRSASSVRALARFYRDALRPLGWRAQPTVIDKATMVALRFTKGDQDISITIMQMGTAAKVSVTGSGLQAAVSAATEAKTADTLVPAAAAEEAELSVQVVSGFPVPTPNSLNGSEKSLYRLQINARVPTRVASVLAFYRRELGKRDGWAEQSEGRVVETNRAVVPYATTEGPAVLTLSTDNGETVVALVVRKTAAAAKAGMLPPPGKVRLLFGNILDGAASVTIGQTTVAIPAGKGGKAPDGPRMDIAPGKHTFSFTLPGQAARADEIDVASGDVWGLMIGPGGVLAVPMY